LRPKEANPLDSLGDIHFYWNRFPEAEKFYRQAYEKDATFENGASLLKAATARLFTGDQSGAKKIFQEYESSRRAARDPIVDFFLSLSDYLLRKPAEAMRRLENFAATTKAPEIAALADCTVTVWLLESGDRAGAAKRNACPFLGNPQGATFPTTAARA